MVTYKKMHLFITLTPQKKLVLPLHYNHFMQAMIYENIDSELAAFLHDQGYRGGGRRFKLFSFSRLNGKFVLDKDTNAIKFAGDMTFTISSPVNNFCQSIVNRLLSKGHIRLGGSEAEIKSVEVQQFTVDKETVILKTLSPIVVYSTLFRADGRKYTCYFQPGDPDYDSLIENNLRKKYQALHGQEAPPGAVKVRKAGFMKMNIINYKETIIKGYSGKVEIAGPKELLQMAVDAGLGSKNSQGFGCVEVGGG